LKTFKFFLQPRTRIDPPQGIFPAQAAVHTETPDLFRRRFFEPLFRRVRYRLAQQRWLQHGRVQLYVLYIAAALAALLIWKLR
jgi:hydrogenase-4 component B